MFLSLIIFISFNTITAQDKLKEISTLVNSTLKAGTYETKFPDNLLAGNRIASGIYFYCLTVGDKIIYIKSMMMVK
jgi:hypothetical protein